MKNKYKGLAEYLVKKDQYLALNLKQARYIVKLVKAFEKEDRKRRLKKAELAYSKFEKTITLKGMLK